MFTLFSSPFLISISPMAAIYYYSIIFHLQKSSQNLFFRDFKELCGWSCATRDHEPGGMENRLSAIGVVDSTAGFEALPRPP